MKFTKETGARAGKLSTRAGTPNKATAEVRKAFQMLVENNLPQIQADLDALEPRDRIKLLLDMANFVLPRLAAVDLTVESDQPSKFVTITLKDERNGTNNT